ILFSVVFSEPVTGFTAGDVSFVGSTAGGALLANVAGSAANYTVSVTGMTSSGNVVVTVPTAAAQDQAGNSSQAPAIVDNTVAFDNVAPTVTVEQATAQADPTGASPIVFAVTFSEPVTGFSASDISFTGSTAGGSLIASVSGSGANYNISVTGTTTAGAVIASIPLGAAQDTAGNSSLASTSVDNVVTFDNVAPSVVINQAATQLDPTSGTPVLFTVAFSEPVTGFSAGDVSLLDSTVGGALLASVTGSGANYTVSVSGMSGTGAVIARVSAGAAADAAGNASAASTSVDNAVTYLPTGPTVTINQGGLQPDPTGTAPITFNVAFSAPVSGFDGSDISFAGSTVGGSLTAGVSGTGASYTVTVTGMTGTGVVAASIPAGVAMDGANNLNQASTSIDNHVTFDNV
ncbi:MAG TPA: Ig-like domain-containing protein, partial [Ilumatobacteraceae bacterium]|nr:Ig-like domain-containing protein [Ilumatobacteraceae bacterium]